MKYTKTFEEFDQNDFINDEKKTIILKSNELSEIFDYLSNKSDEFSNNIQLKAKELKRKKLVKIGPELEQKEKDTIKKHVNDMEKDGYSFTYDAHKSTNCAIIGFKYKVIGHDKIKDFIMR